MKARSSFLALTHTLAGALILFAASPAASAAVIGIDMAAGSIASYTCGAGQGPVCVAGYTFHVNSTVSATALGYFDIGSNGLAEQHTVGLFSIAGTLLGSATVSSSSTIVASGSPLGRWYFTDITPLALAPGDYVLAATLSELSGDPVEANATITSIPQITFLNARVQINQTGLIAPPSDSSSLNAGFFGPGIEVDVTPEPGTVVLVASGILCIAILRRRQRLVLRRP